MPVPACLTWIGRLIKAADADIAYALTVQVPPDSKCVRKNSMALDGWRQSSHVLALI